MSDIFNNYAKIMEEKGLLKNAQRSSETKTRPQGIDPEAIQMLYHVKPNGKDEKPIVEQAHPEPAYVAPAYDRMNGLVENVQERQNMLLEIMEDPQHGKLTHHRYVHANNELLQELIRVATYMDNKNEEDLMKLADDCAFKLTKSATPIFAAIPFLTWALAAKAVAYTALAGGAYAAISNGVNLSAGVIQDAESVIEESRDIISPDWWVLEDDELPPEVKEQVRQLQSLAVKVKNSSSEANRMRNALLKTLKKTEAAIESPNEEPDKNVKKLVSNEYHDNLVKFFKKYQERTSEYLNELSRLNDKLQKSFDLYQQSGSMLLGIKRMMVPSHLQDIIKASERLLKSLSEENASISLDLEELNNLGQAHAKVQEKSKEENLEGKTEEEKEIDLDVFLENLSNQPAIQLTPEAAADDESY